MTPHRLSSFFAPAASSDRVDYAVSTPKFAAVPQGIAAGGFQAWQSALYDWAKKKAVADVAAAKRSRRIWSTSSN